MFLWQERQQSFFKLWCYRKFSFRHIQSKEKVELWLQPGQLIVMRGETQQYWQHRLNRSTKILQPRINLTFRQFKFYNLH